MYTYLRTYSQIGNSMNYALDQFTMTDGEVLIVQGANSLYTYQNTGNSSALIQGSNDTTHWTDIAQIAVGNSLIKEHSYKYLRLVGQTRVDVNRGEGDNTTGGGSSGGTASYPSFTDNAGKVLTVNATEDGVEWEAVSSGGGGINVIEYDPSLHEIVSSTVVGTDLQPIKGSTAQTYNIANWNAATGVMTIAGSPVTTESYVGNTAQYSGVRLEPSLLDFRGTFTIDASLCEDGWGIALLERETYYGHDRIDLFVYLEQQHYKTVYGGAQDIQQPNAFGMFLKEDDTYEKRSWVSDVFSSVYGASSRGSYTTKPQSVYTFTVGGVTDYLMVAAGFTYEQAVAYITGNFPPNDAATILARTVVFNVDLDLILEVKANTPYLHIFMNAYHKASQTGTHLLNPTSQLTITYDLKEVGNVPPAAAVDGDFLHLTGNANMFGKALTVGDFVQLYDNKTKMIVHSNQP